jgi:NAD+--dinitrogen-reductase ADP-D-ribosyltransferase
MRTDVPQTPALCGNGDRTPEPRLPRGSHLPINRCNLPARILGGLAFQQAPKALRIDGVHDLNRGLFDSLQALPRPDERRALFETHMQAAFQLDQPEAIGYDPASSHPGRHRLDYRRLLRGWLFDSNAREAAALKGWVESRFGLLPRAHAGPLRDPEGAGYRRYCLERALALTNTNALEAQLDLLYSYAQFELARAPVRCIDLFRGVNAPQDFEQAGDRDGREPVLLLNNLNAFTDSPERAGEFGDVVLQARVPLAKLLFFPGLLDGALRGEGEYLVIGGLYRVRLRRI